MARTFTVNQQLPSGLLQCPYLVHLSEGRANKSREDMSRSAGSFSDDVTQLHGVCLSFLTGQQQPPHKHCRILHRDETQGLIPWAVLPWGEIGTMKEEHVAFHNTWILSTCAVVEYEDLSTTGYVTALKPSAKSGWTVVSLLFESVRDWPVVKPDDMVGAITCCWDCYRAANRACDGKAMADVFHPFARLTYVNDGDGEIVEVSSKEFCNLVEDRYNREPHSKYAKQKDRSEALVASRDTLLGCSAATSKLALVRLKVGHPPFLWTDLLVCACVDDKWWIVAKSSDHEDFVPTME